MNPNSNTPLNSSDDGIVHFDLDDTPMPEATPTRNFVDNTEEGLFDFDLEDLENLFNSTAQPVSTPIQGVADTHTQVNAQTSNSLPPLDLDIPSVSPTIAPSSTAANVSHDLPHDLSHSQADDFFDLEKSWNTPAAAPTTSVVTALDTPSTSVVPTPLSLENPSNISDLETIASTNPSTLSDHTTATSESLHPSAVNSPITPTTTDSMALGGVAAASTAATLAASSTPKPKNTKKGLFSGFGNKKPIPQAVPTTAEIAGTTPPPIIVPKKQPPKNNKLLLILAGILGLGVLAWLASQFLAEPTPAPKAAPAVKAPAPTATPTPVSATAVTATPPPIQASATAPVAVATAASAPSTTGAKNLIKPEEILTTPLPKDNAVAKEEIDRLADQSKQLSQQEKMMEEQLKMMNELSSKKEERIAILEKQIAQAEAQKAQAKK